MQQVEEYRRQAAECEALARIARNETQREQILRIAETWRKLAVDRERQLRSRQHGAPAAGTIRRCTERGGAGCRLRGERGEVVAGARKPSENSPSAGGPLLFSNVDVLAEYRRRAAECERLAADAITEEHERLPKPDTL